MRHDRPAQQLTVVTSAGLSHTDDIALRQRRYVMTQSVRIACVLLAAALPVSLAWKGVFMAGAIGLPWFGVVMANAGPTVKRTRSTAMLDRVEAAEPVRIAIEPGRTIDQER